MNKVMFLQALKKFTADAVKDLMLPVSVQSEKDDGALRPAAVHLMHLPDSKSFSKKAPYIIHQLISGSDSQNEGQAEESRVTVRSIFCVYCGDDEVGGLQLLNLMERLRIALLRKRIIGEQYVLDLQTPMECLCYPDDTAPYFAGEMVSVWKLPAVRQEVSFL